MDLNSFNEDNSKYWDEPCGTVRLGKVDLDLTKEIDLKVYDDWYFDYYPYLQFYLEKTVHKDDFCLEIGLGLGAVTRLLASQVKNLDALDVAHGPISFIRETLKDSRNVRFVNGSILQNNLERRYDSIVAIGSLHHSGNFQLAIENVERILKPGGRLLIMVYYAFSPRRLLFSPIQSFSLMLARISSSKGEFFFNEQRAKFRKQADVNSSGEPPPYTAFVTKSFFNSRTEISYKCELNNIQIIQLTRKPLGRKFFLKRFGKYFGCDLYAFGVKPRNHL